MLQIIRELVWLCEAFKWSSLGPRFVGPGFKSGYHRIIFFPQDLLSQLEDSVQNVSAKAMSSEVVCAANRAKLESIETKIRDLDSSRAVESRPAENRTRP